MGDRDDRPGAGRRRPDREDELGTTGRKREEESREPPDKPHVVEGEDEGSVQEDHDEAGAGVKRPSMPATGHGEDRAEGGEGIDPESMYEGRPEEDKDVSPEDVAGKKKRS